MVSKTVFIILIISILFVSGCVGNDVDVTELVKQTQQGQDFLSKYPSAEITAVSLSNETIASMIDEIRIDCHPTIPVKAYWNVKFTDPDTNTKLNVWIDKETQEVICIIKKANTNKTEPNNQPQDIPENNDNPIPEIRKNCRELNGFLCDESNECAVDWLDSSDSYCCPIQCGSCPEDVNCDDEDKCTKDYCVVENGKAICKHEKITPCANNGICEPEEIETCDSTSGYAGRITGPALCCPGTTHAIRSKTIESSDCPKNCDDGNDNTADYYNFTAQKCEHYACGGVTITGNTYDFNNVFVTIKLYNVKDKGIGEYISIKNNRDDTVIIGTGCNYPISPYADSCSGWSLRPYDDYPTFNHKYVEQNSEVNGWVWGITENFLEPYNTSLIKLTIQIDGEEISFVKNMEYIEDFIEDFEETTNIIDENVNYKFDDYYSYQKYVAEELEAETGVEDIGKYGSDVSTRFDGSVYFLMSKSDSWGETYRFWAVQVNAETGELIKYREIANDGCSGQPGKCPNTEELWWTPEN